MLKLLSGYSSSPEKIRFYGLLIGRVRFLPLEANRKGMDGRCAGVKHFAGINLMRDVKGCEVEYLLYNGMDSVCCPGMVDCFWL